jgi:hypothetical protein
MPKNPKLSHSTVWIPVALRDRLKVHCLETGMKMRAVAERAIREWLDRNAPDDGRERHEG